MAFPAGDLPGPAPVLVSGATLDAAAAHLRAGRLVVFPTETVYGLGAVARDADAVARVFAAKGRPRFNPLIVHVADAREAARLVLWDERAEALAERFWPGPLTLVLPVRDQAPVARLATAGLPSIAVRAPAHPAARALIERVGEPLAAPSANRSETLSPTLAAHARALGGAVAMILDGGPCGVGVESTVLDLTGATPAILRPGGLARAAIEATTGPLAGDDDDGNAPRSPGRSRRHYAPRTPVRPDARAVAADEALLAFGHDAPEGGCARINLSPTGDVAEAAARLFDALHRLDAVGARAIAAMPVPETGLGEAINDRLRRAAAAGVAEGARSADSESNELTSSW